MTATETMSNPSVSAHPADGFGTSGGSYRRPWRHLSAALVCAFVVALDAFAVAASGLLAFGLHINLAEMAVDVVLHCALTFSAASLMVTFGGFCGLYDQTMPKRSYLHLGRALATWMCAVLVVLGGLFFLQAGNHVSRGWVGYWFVLGAVGLCATRLGLRGKIARWRALGFMRERVVVVGASETVARLVSRLERPEYRDAYEILGVFDGGDAPVPSCGLPGAYRRLGPADAVLDFVRANPVEVAIVSTAPRIAAATGELCARLSEVSIKVHLCPDQGDLGPPVIEAGLFGDVLLLQVNRPTLSEAARIAKGIEDRVLALVLLAVTSPLMALAALAVRLDSPGPILFRQQRFGFNNRVITVLKFRTMHAAQADATGARRTVWGDARVTRVGRVLRRTSIDELPQLLNVLRGEMSLVGPRAHPLHMKVLDRYYHEAMPGYAGRHRVKPGLTGLAQINGCRGEIDSFEKAQARLKYDLEYVSRWSLLLDLKIVVLTPFRAFGKAY